MAGSAFKNAKSVEQIERSFTPVLVDGDDAANQTLMRRYDVPGYPTVVFTDAKGEALGVVVGPDVAKFEATLARLAK